MTTAASFHHAATVTVDAAALSSAMAVRGLDQMALARLSGLSNATISKALRHRPVTGPTFARIARALAAAPVVELAGAETLLAHRDPLRYGEAAPALEAEAARGGSHASGNPG